MNRAILATLLLLAACKGTPKLDEEMSSLSRITNPSVPAGDASSLVAGNTTFASQLHRGLMNALDGNVVYSPYGISFNMAMLREWLPPDEKAGLDAALGFSLPDAQLDPAWDALDLSLTSVQGKTADGSGQQFFTASAIWTLAPVTPGYLDTLAQYYGTGVLDGKDPEQAITDWQATLPGQPLPFQLAQPCDMALVSDVRLDAAWQNAFDPNLTHAGDFHKADGSVVSAQMMHANPVELAFSTSSPAAIELPYDGGALSMLVVVPDDIAGFDAALTPQAVDQIAARLQSGEVDLTMPKVKFGTSTSVLDQLQALGLPLDAGHYTIWHSATLEIDESGTIAAAMTTTSHTPASVVQTTPFAVDRPFVFFIRDRASGSILFSGRVLDPTAM